MSLRFPASARLRALLCCALALQPVSALPPSRASDPQLRALISGILAAQQRKWNMSLAVAYHTPNTTIALSAGYSNAGLGVHQSGSALRRSLPTDKYVWGSTTKMFTGAAVLQLVDRGLVRLQDPIGQHIDPLLMAQNGTTLEDKFGPPIRGVTVHDLLHMTSGLADYDRGNYTADQFSHPATDFSPIQILSQYVNASLEFAPGTQQAYCSTNFILLGLILAHHLAADSWQHYQQLSVLPPGLRAALNQSVFVNQGACGAYTPVHGFMAPGFYDPHQTRVKDVINVSCAGGWTAGNYVGSVRDVALFTHALYSPSGDVISAASRAAQLNFSSPSGGPGQSFKFYGLGTFSLDWTASTPSLPVIGYGHVGDTYGYQSQSTYFPDQDAVIAVGTNIETDSQAQPAETTCLLYHAIRAALRGQEQPRCSFRVPRRFIGQCNCSSG